MFRGNKFLLNSLEQFITILNTNKKFINFLFENRKINISIDTVIDSFPVEIEKLDYLVENSILNQNADNISLDISLLEFFEDFLNISEQINTAYISDTVKRLENNIDYYTYETIEQRKEGYLTEIKKDMKGISRNIKKEIIALKRNIDNVYKTEQNFNIKKKKLEDYKQKRDNIIGLKESIEKLLGIKRIILESMGDLELNSIVTNVYKMLEECYTYLIEIQQELILYINKAQIYGEIFRKVQKLKYLKDHQEIKYKTDIIKVIAREHSLILQTRKTFYSKISLNFIQTDEGFEVVKKLAKKNKTKLKAQLPLMEVIPANYFEESEDFEEIIDYEIIKKAFYKSNQDLFNFILNHNLGREFSFHQRLNIFCSMVSEFEDDLIIKDNVGSYNNLNYALIYPRGFK